MAKKYEDYKFEIKSGHEQMGRFVEQWSVDPSTRPESMAELVKLLSDNGVVVEVGNELKEIDWQPMSYENTLTVLLPPKELLSGFPGDDYPLPKFYSEMAFGGKQHAINREREFQYSRIGEYTTQKCW